MEGSNCLARRAAVPATRTSTTGPRADQERLEVISHEVVDATAAAVRRPAGRTRARRADRSWPAPDGCPCRSARPRPRARHAPQRSARLPRIFPVTSNATQSRASRLCPNSSSACGLASIRPAERSRPSGHDCDLAVVAVHIQRYRPHPILLALVDLHENRWANDIDGSALAAQPGRSQRRPLKSPGWKPIQTGLPNLRSPQGPSSQSTEPKPTPRRQNLRAQFMPR